MSDIGIDQVSPSDVNQVLDTDQIENQDVKDAIDKIKNDPHRVMDIIRSIKDNEEVFTQVIAYIESNQDLKGVMRNMSKNPSSTGSIDNMKTKEKRELIKKYRRAKSSLVPKVSTMKTCRITSSRQVKTIDVGTDFPNRTKYNDNDPIELMDGIYLFYSDESTIDNKKATRLAGVTIRGQVILARMNLDGECSPFTLSEFKTHFN